MRPGWSVAAAVCLVAVPIVFGVILFFGGGQVNSCLGGTGCGLEPPTPTLGLLGRDVTGLSATVLAVGWLALAVVVARRVWQRDSGRLRRVIAATAAFAGTAGIAVAAARFLEGMPRRTIVTEAALFAFGAALIIAPLALGWAILTVRRQRA